MRALVASLGLSAAVSVEPFVDDPAPLYGWADVVAMPSRRPESLGRVAIEAMAFGRPPLASAIGGLGEVVVERETAACCRRETPPRSEPRSPTSSATPDSCAPMPRPDALAMKLFSARRLRRRRSPKRQRQPWPPHERGSFNARASRAAARQADRRRGDAERLPPRTQPPRCCMRCPPTSTASSRC